MCVQEHRKKQNDCVFAESWLRARGMQGHFESALPTRKVNLGRAGVAIIARSHIGLRPVQLSTDDQKLFAGRLAVAHLQGMVKGGVMIYSFYGVAGAGIKGNLHLLLRLQTLLREQRLPWLVGADWNLSDEELASIDWATTAGGQIVSSRSTCANGHRCIDYWVVCERLATSFCNLQVQDDAPTSPHWPVALCMQSVSLAATQLVARKWRRFPRRCPIGCVQFWQERDWTWQAGQHPNDPTHAWQEWEAEVENYLCMVHGITPEQRCQYTGRAAGFRLVRRPLSDTWAKHVHPQCSQSSRAWLKLEHLLADTRHGYFCAGGRHLLRRLHELTPKFEEDLSPLVLCQRHWTLPDLLRYYAKCPHHQAIVLSAEVQTRLKKEWCVSASQGTQKWSTWVHEHLHGGARDLHRWCKKDAPPLQHPYNRWGEPDHLGGGLESIRAEWESVWRVHADHTQPASPHMPKLRPLKVSDLRRAVEQYPPNKGMGSDCWDPGSWSCLTDTQLQRFLDIVHTAEEQLRWPNSWEILFSMLPKSATRCRPIGLVHAGLRMWSKLRREDIRTWEQQHLSAATWGCDRNTCLRASWESQLHMERASNLNLAAAQMWLDVRMFYEHVRHESVLNAARYRNFPERLAFMACTAYTQPRRIQWRGQTTEAWRVYGTIVPGCGMANALAMLVMQEAHEEVAALGLPLELKN
eukprot:2418715-Amphidinium_carterae.1